MGQEVCSIAKKHLEACQNTHTIPRYNIAIEIIPPRCSIAGSEICAACIRIGWEHPLFFVFRSVIVQNSGLESEVIIIFHDIVGIIASEREVALRSNDNSSSIANPFVGL